MHEIGLKLITRRPKIRALPLYSKRHPHRCLFRITVLTLTDFWSTGGGFCLRQLQCKRPTEATLGDGGEDLLEIEDASRISQRQILLSCLRPSIREVETTETIGVSGDVGQNLSLGLVQVKSVVAGRLVWLSPTESSDALDAHKKPLRT